MYKGEIGPVTMAVLWALAVLGACPRGEAQRPCLPLLDRGTGTISQKDECGLSMGCVHTSLYMPT